MMETTDRPTKGAVRVATIITNGRIRLQKTRRYLACDRGNKSTIGVADMIDRVTGLGQALDALRGVLPYAEQELAGLHEAARRDSDETYAEEATRADAAIDSVIAAIETIDPADKPLLPAREGGAA